VSEPDYRPPDLALIGAEHIRRYQDTDGEVGYLWNGAPILLLTTTGRTSGEPRTSALIFGRDRDDYLIVASMGGAPQHPQWYRNLVADPHVEVQIKSERFAGLARTVESAERERCWQLAAAQWPNYDEYAKRTTREIPVVVLERA
jgi:deazaflavin-dependent oxidoreductase (nitroreductase family)